MSGDANLEEMAKILEISGKYKVLRRLQPGVTA